MDLQNLMIMKTLKDLKAFSLDKKQMNQIEGGSQYCEHLQQMTRVAVGSWLERIVWMVIL